MPIQKWMIFVAMPTKVWTTACGEIQRLKLPSNCHQTAINSPKNRPTQHNGATRTVFLYC